MTAGRGCLAEGPGVWDSGEQATLRAGCGGGEGQDPMGPFSPLCLVTVWFLLLLCCETTLSTPASSSPG